MTVTGGMPFGGGLRWIGSFALLATSIWTGIAGGFGLYTRQVGATRAWTAVAAALAAVESGKAFGMRQPADQGVPPKASAAPSSAP